MIYVVTAYRNGKIAYTGTSDRAAERFRVPERELLTKYPMVIDGGTDESGVPIEYTATCKPVDERRPYRAAAE